MGRPLNKKWFGNENTGGIAGGGVASVTIDTAGTYTSSLPTVSFNAPPIAGGVTATGTVHGEALSAVATAAGSGYNLADVLTQTTGGTGTYATWNVTGLKVISITLNNGGTANDVGDEFEYTIAGFTSPLRVRVTADTAGVATAVEIVSGGVWTTGALPTNTTSMTMTQVVAGTDMNGQNLEVNITGWGVATVSAATRGDYTAISSGAKATSVTPTGGTSATLTITYRVKSVEITEAGSGYTNADDAEPEFDGGSAAGTSELTTSSGVPYTDDAFPTILANAWIPASGAAGYVSGAGGSSSEFADIIKQEATRRFRVETEQGIGYCNLVAAAPSAGGQMNITATDSESKTYYVTKITSRKATVVPYGTSGHKFPVTVVVINGESTNQPQTVHWTMTANVQIDPTYDANTTVVINNA
jgi:hypothetical protein